MQIPWQQCSKLGPSILYSMPVALASAVCTGLMHPLSYRMAELAAVVASSAVCLSILVYQQKGHLVIIKLCCISLIITRRNGLLELLPKNNVNQYCFPGNIFYILFNQIVIRILS
jgi:hypothetical protein